MLASISRLLLLAVLALALRAQPEPDRTSGVVRDMAADPPSEALCVMTYNLRFASDQPPNAWPDRRPVMLDCIRQVAPDVIGTQEGLYQQLRDLATDLPEYEWIGLGREGGSRGEFMAVFYRSSRLDPVAFDHFWLSDTPELIGSTTWGHVHRRMVTWVRFRDRRTGAEFYLWNTHFDHEVQPAREKSAKLIRDRIATLAPDIPVLLVGDFNVPAGANPVYSTFVDDGFFTDTWTAAPKRRNEQFGTFNGFGKTPTGGTRIDWILTRGQVAVDATEVVTFTRDGQYPSDHYPVVAWVRIGSGRNPKP
jgi:endonuclease/exonuclease/phosphatase family metal-dependent hydrolase